MISVQPVSKGRGLSDFIRVPGIIYAGDVQYVPQLFWERRMHLSKANPYFKHSTVQFFVAYDDGKPVGRISAQIDRLAQKGDGIVLGHFGFLDAVNDAVLTALFDAAEAWLLQHGAHKVVGPYSLSINDESGLLVEGFEAAPRIMMNYVPAWLGAAVEAAGYQKAKDLIAYKLHTDTPLPGPAQRMAAKAFETPGMVERTLNPQRTTQDLQTILRIFNDAWQNNWGFVPMTEDEIAYVAKSMKPLLRPKMARLVEVNGEPAAMIVGLPDLNEAISGLRGRLLPFGWAKVLWRLKVRGLSAGRVLLMGVRQEDQKGFRGGAFAALLIHRLREEMQRDGFKEAELSWILEDNLPIIRLIESLGAVAYKRYRLYEKELMG